MRNPGIRIVFWFLLVLGGILVAFAWFSARRNADPRTNARVNIHDADIPSFRKASLDPHFILLSPYDLIQAPVIDFFTSPLGGEYGSFTYDAQGFGVENKLREGRHWGQDLNGIGGNDTDFGDPVYAVGRGRVVYSGCPAPGWGNVVVLLHRLPDGGVIESLYAHLSKITVRVGDMVGRGELLGNVGNAGGRYFAHLHFEMIDSFFNEAGMPGYGVTTANRLDPDDVFKKYAPQRDVPLPDPLPALRQLQLDEDLEKIDFKALR